jgi:hypothetical protein
LLTKKPRREFRKENSVKNQTVVSSRVMIKSVEEQNKLRNFLKRKLKIYSVNKEEKFAKNNKKSA